MKPNSLTCESKVLTIKNHQGWSWQGGSGVPVNPPPPFVSFFLKLFLSKTWHGSQHDNLVSTLCLTKCDFPLKDPGYAPDNIYHFPTNVHQPW